MAFLQRTVSDVTLHGDADQVRTFSIQDQQAPDRNVSPA
jgi:hypothetical protein